jgi:hypothetical protein
MRCGYCGGEMAGAFSLGAKPVEGRCPCGRRAVTMLPGGGTLVHREGCDGGDGCPCMEGARVVLDG